MGRQSKLQEWEKDENILLIRGWRRGGLQIKDIANNIGITERTLFNWSDKSEIIKNSLKMGKTEANFIIENALFNKARAGNMTAIIFWLKNNWRNKYSDTQRTELEEMLTQKQIDKVVAETDIAKARADILRGSDEKVEGVLSNYLDELMGVGSDESEGTDEQESNKKDEGEA